MGTINPSVLKWAREDSALSLSEAASKLGFSDTRTSPGYQKLEAIETGRSEVSKHQLEKMSRVYRKSLLVLYSTEIPEKRKIVTDFRKMNLDISSQENAWLETLLLDFLVRQSILIDAINEDEEYQSFSNIGSISTDTTSHDVKRVVIDITGFDLGLYRQKRNFDEAFNYARNCIESSGVFVVLAGNLGNFRTTLSTNVFRGFSLVENSAPMMVINSNDSKGALVFTLFHEFVHVLLGQSSVSNGNDELSVENLCDQVANKILLPDEDFENLDFFKDFEFEQSLLIIEKMVKDLKVSYTAIAFNLLKHGLIGKDLFNQLVDHYQQEYIEQRNKTKDKQKKSQPNYASVKNYQNGKHLTTLVKDFLQEGTISYREASKVLGARQMTLRSLIAG